MKKFFTAIVAMMLAVPSFAQFSSGGFELDKQNVYWGARMGLALGCCLATPRQVSMIIAE